MITKAAFRIHICCASILLSGCSAQYILASNPSLKENNGLLPDKTYSLNDMTFTMSSDGIEISPVIGNEKVLHGHEEVAVLIPYRRWGERKLSVGSKPLRISLYIRAEGAGALFSPAGTKLFLGGDSVSAYPTKIVRVEKTRECLFDNPSSGSVVSGDSAINLFNKLTVLTDTGSEIQDWSIPHWTCVQFYFDVAMPDPSNNFRLQLGKITTPQQKLIQPTIYYSPITYRSNMR